MTPEMEAVIRKCCPKKGRITADEIIIDVHLGFASKLVSDAFNLGAKPREEVAKILREQGGYPPTTAEACKSLKSSLSKLLEVT